MKTEEQIHKKIHELKSEKEHLRFVSNSYYQISNIQQWIYALEWVIGE